MNNFSKLFILVLIIATVSPYRSFASTKEDKVTKDLKTLKNDLRQLERDSDKLSSSQKAHLKSTLPKSTRSGLTDSDDDGVPDAIEENIDHTNQCDSGSHEGGSKLEAIGSIASVNGATFIVRTQSFITDAFTKYEDGDATSLVTGACVEVKGETITGSSDFTAVKVSFHNPSDCHREGDYH